MKKTISIFILLLTSYFSRAQEKVNFSDSFIKAKGKSKIQIHEVKGVIQIMVALTATGKENDQWRSWMEMKKQLKY